MRKRTIDNQDNIKLRQHNVFVILKYSWTEKKLKMCAFLWTLEMIELPSCLGNISNPSVWSIVLKNQSLKGYSAITLLLPKTSSPLMKNAQNGGIVVKGEFGLDQRHILANRNRKHRNREVGLKGLIWDWSKEWLPKSPHGTAATSYSRRGLLP